MNRSTDREAWRERVGEWRRYNERQSASDDPRPVAERIAAATWLYDLLPPASRVRAVDPSGIGRMRACLSVLATPARPALGDADGLPRRRPRSGRRR